MKRLVLDIKNLFSSKMQAFLHWFIITFFIVAILTPIVLVDQPIRDYKNSGYNDRFFGSRHDYDGQLNYNEIMAFAERLDLLTDQIESENLNWFPRATSETVYMFIAEMAAQFQYEGTTENVNYPDFRFEAAGLGGRHNHIAGYSNCDNLFVLNLRFANPVSTWNGNSNWIATLVHELAHNHQGEAICQESEKELVETTAQLMSYEILAGLANQGNEIALFTLLYSLRSDALGMGLGLALSESNEALDFFEDDLRELNDNNFLKWSKYQKSMRFWSNDLERLKWILLNYSSKPLNLVATHRFGGAIPFLAINNETNDLRIDDLLYLMENMESMVEQALENLKT